MTTAKPLDLTLEVAPTARFDVVEMRSRFAAEHRALAEYSPPPLDRAIAEEVDAFIARRIEEGGEKSDF